MNRAGKDKAMAVEMATKAQRLPAGTVAGVAGNTREHSERLCALVLVEAKRLGLDVSHVTFKPLDTERLLDHARELPQ